MPSLWHTTQRYPHGVGMWMVAYICPVQTADVRVCIYLRVCMHCIADASLQRPAIVPPMVYLHLTQAGAWCEM